MGRKVVLTLLVLGMPCAALAATAWTADGHPPRYRSCGRVSIGFATPVHAHNVSCATARKVVSQCSAKKGTCFGQLALPYKGVGEPTLPEAPAFRPLGFQCYQVWGAFTAGLPPLPTRLVADPKLILCSRQASRKAKSGGLIVYQQLIAYIV